jgi:hypothetical protein
MCMLTGCMGQGRLTACAQRQTTARTASRPVAPEPRHRGRVRVSLLLAGIVCLVVGAFVTSALAAKHGHHREPSCRVARGKKPPRVCSVLLGDRHIEAKHASQDAGRAEAIPFRAQRTGTARSARVYVDGTSQATRVSVGVYGSRRGVPARLLTSGSIGRPSRHAWDAVALHRVRLVKGRRYWVALLGRGGSLAYRAKARGGCRSWTSARADLKGFFGQWRGAGRHNTCRVSITVLSAKAPRATRHAPAGPAPGPAPAPPAPAPPPVPPSAPPYVQVPCTTTLNPGANIQSALSSAAPGAGVCLNAGDYNTSTEIDLSNIAPAGTVTLEPAPGAAVNLGWVNMTGTNRNLTIQGFNLTGGVSETGGASGLIYGHNTVSGDAGASQGFYFFADGGQQNGIQVIANQMNNLAPADLSPTGAGQCVTVAGGQNIEHNFTVNYNTCGPGIGNHYTQFGGIDGLTEDYNQFLGPAAPEALSQQTHNNVIQIFGDSDNIDFSHNVLRNNDSRGQEVLFEEGSLTNVTMNANLFVGDPMCLKNVNCYSYAVGLCAVQNLQFNYNTVVGFFWGVQVTNSDGGVNGCDATGTGYAVTHNIVVNTPDNADITYAECASSCTYAYNVTDDTSSREGANPAVFNWKPRWTDATSYLPVGLPFAAGYGSG